MSQIAEKKTLEAYPICNCYNEQCMMKEDVNLELRIGYEEGYDQAMKDVMKHAEELQFRSDDFGYAYGCGYEKAMQDFLEKACEWLTYNNNLHDGEIDLYVKDFKNYMQDES